MSHTIPPDPATLSTSPNPPTNTPTPTPTPQGPILFYDADCGLCQRSIQFCIKRDPKQQLRFAPLTGTTYATITQHLEQTGSTPTEPPTNTVVLYDQAQLHIRTEAVRRALHHLAQPWPTLATALRLIPRPIRDAAYRLIARYRRRLAPPPACNIDQIDAARARTLP